MQKNKIISHINTIKLSKYLSDKFRLLQKGNNIFILKDSIKLLQALLEIKTSATTLRLLFGKAVIDVPGLSLSFLTHEKKPVIDTTSENSEKISKAQISIYSCLSNLSANNLEIIAPLLKRDFALLGFIEGKKMNKNRHRSDLFNALQSFRSENFAYIKKIIDDEADVNCFDSNSRTPLINAVMCSNLDAIKLFLMCGDIEVNIRDNFGNTALHMAVIMNKADVVQMLLDTRNVDISIKNMSDKTAFDIAKEKNYKVIETLLSAYK